MTNYERIKRLDFDKMASLFAWGRCFYPDLEVPACDEGCPDYGEGCMNGCSHDKQERAVREWLESECDAE